LVDNVPIRGTRSSSDIYERCNIVFCQPTNFRAVEEDQNWMDAMKEELFMIEKNQTWKLVDQLQDKKVIEVK